VKSKKKPRSLNVRNIIHFWLGKRRDGNAGKKFQPLNSAKLEKYMQPGKYQHYKGKYYEVIGVARHGETLEELVVYRALYSSEEFGENALWVRPKKMFLEDVVIDGKKVPRFMFVG